MSPFNFESINMKFRLVSPQQLLIVATAGLILAGLVGCQSMEEMRAERAKNGERVDRMTGSNIPRKDGASDVKVASGEALRGIEAAGAAAAAAASGGGK